MTGTARVKDTSTFKYKGLTLDIIGLHIYHTREDMNDIFPVGSCTYKLSLANTKWAKEFVNPDNAYTILHDSHLENITCEGTVEANVWYDSLGKRGQQVINELFNHKLDKSPDEIYEKFNMLKVRK